jgi:hypothetical protein
MTATRDGLLMLRQLRDRLQATRDLVADLRSEVIAARGGRASLAARLSAIESRLPPP